MKKVVTWGLVLSYIALCIAICVMGIKIFDGNYDIVAEGCIAFIFLLIETIPNPQQSWGESCTQVAMNEVP